uniref:Uncharacterized protein n=1 Tax=Arundo donax TaxID=35708 RepID=A0A0A9BLD6_ARUDO
MVTALSEYARPVFHPGLSIIF